MTTAERRLTPARWMIAGLGAGILALLLLAMARALGTNIPTGNVELDYAKGALWAALLGATIVLWPASPRDRVMLLGLWGVRCLIVLGFMLLYEKHYPVLDTYGYFSQGVAGPDADLAIEVGSGMYLVMRIVHMHATHLVLSFHAVKTSFALLGFAGTYIFYRAACCAIGREEPRLLLALSFFPSILFWSSILGKDPIVYFGLSIYCFGVVHWIRRGQAMWLVPCAIGVLIAMSIRLWLGPICLLPMMLIGMRATRSWWRRVLFLVLAAIALSVVLGALRTYFAIQSLSDSLALIGRVSTAWAPDGGGAIDAGPDLSNPIALLRFMPFGFFTALARPLPGEILNAFGLLAGLENVVVLTLFLRVLRNHRREDLRDPVAVWAIAFIVVWGLLYAPVSYQNLGAAVRFRLQILAPMLITLLVLGRPRSAPARAPA